MSKTFENDFFWSSSLDCCFQNRLTKKNTKKNMDNIEPPKKANIDTKSLVIY